jgi:hypothetical protein
VRKALQVEVEHLPRFGKPLRAITLDAQAEAVLSFIVVNVDRGMRCSSIGRKDRLPSTQMSADRSRLAKPRALQSHRDGDRAFLSEDEPSISLAEVGDRDALRECPPLLDIEAFQQRNRRKKWIVSARRAERERLQERTGIFVTVAYCSAAKVRGDASLSSTIDSSSGFIRSSRCQPTS